MEDLTKHRDAWAKAKQANLPQLLQASSVGLVGAHRDALALGKLIHDVSRATSFGEFYAGIDRLAELSRSIAYSVHNLKTLCDFQVPPATQFTDHYVNQFFLMSALKRTWWVEGPAFCGLALEPGARVLQLGCGTGYETDVFFSPFAAEIVAIDVDPRAIETARRMHPAKNVRYEVMDLRKTLPQGPFDVAIWSPTIFAYTPEEVDAFMPRLREVLTETATLCGWTYVEADRPGPNVLWHDMQSLAERLKRHFKNVRAFERVHPTIQPPRHALFFYASDASLPFDPDWPHGVRL